MLDNIHHSIPIELMDILNRINENINEVKERITRIEAQDHSDSLRVVRAEIKEEREKRIELEISIATVKSRLAPIVFGISIIGTVGIQMLFKAIGDLAK